MKFKKTDLALILGVVLIAGPLLLDWPLGVAWYTGALVGVVLVSIAGYDAQARMLKMGMPGEDLLQSIWDFFRRTIKNVKFRRKD